MAPDPDSAAENGDGTPCPARFAVATVSLMSPPTPCFQPAFRTAVALATIATDADCERRPASRLGAKPKGQNSVPVDSAEPLRKLVISSDGGPALTACFAVAFSDDVIQELSEKWLVGDSVTTWRQRRIYFP